MSNPSVVVFSKAPRDPSAKSRLQKILPKDQVLSLHQAFLFDALRAVQEMHSPINLSCYWAAEEAELPSLKSLAEGDHFLQQGETFLERLSHCLQAERKQSSAPLLLIGSDCPLLSPELLDRAADAISSGKLTIGPSPEGGFYLLGIPADVPIRDLSIAFQHPLESVGVRELYADLECTLLPFLPDVDLEQDLVSLIAMTRLLLSSQQEADARWIPEATVQAVKDIDISMREGSREKQIG